MTKFSSLTKLLLPTAEARQAGTVRCVTSAEPLLSAISPSAPAHKKKRDGERSNEREREEKRKRGRERK